MEMLTLHEGARGSFIGMLMHRDLTKKICLGLNSDFFFFLKHNLDDLHSSYTEIENDFQNVFFQLENLLELPLQNNRSINHMQYEG